MDDVKLYDKQEAVRAKFDEFAAKKTSIEGEIEEIVIEMNRLQGEWRVIDALRKELALETGVDPALTIVAEPEAPGRKTRSKKSGN